ncbi:hypothetical protein DFH28DRAFT_1161658 [Melampsora americana]|nr:hypothetical protein DFH28DRAFT_1161658 [Melampsora americana]
MSAVQGEQQTLDMSLVTRVVKSLLLLFHLVHHLHVDESIKEFFLMSQGGSGPYDYGPHGNGPLPARGPLNPNDPSSNQYNPHSFLPCDGRFDPYSAPSNPGGHRNSTTLPPRYPNPNPEQIPPIHSSTATQSTILPVFDTLATQANLNAENRERARICSNRMENDPRLIGLVVYTAQCHQDLIQRLTQSSATQPSPISLSTITPTESTPEWVPKEELKKFCVDVLLESISDPNLQAYTLTEGVISAAGQKKTLIHSLEMIVQIRMQHKDDPWKSRNFPPGYTNRFPSEVIKEIKKKIKIVRENLHSILRHNASPNHGHVTNPLPTLQDLYLSIDSMLTGSLLYFT